jgi:hypothetical protein
MSVQAYAGIWYHIPAYARIRVTIIIFGLTIFIFGLILLIQILGLTILSK